MKLGEVPQDKGMNCGLMEVAYAVDDQGRYRLAASAGWEPKNVSNDQAWGLIDEDINAAINDIRSGQKSPLAYYMVKNLMNIRLLAEYMNVTTWTIRRHLKPDVFRKLNAEVLAQYAALFEISIDELRQIPGVVK